MKSLSIRSANLLYLITIGLILTLGSLIQYWSLSWGLVLTEIFLILLPALLFLRRGKIPLRQGLRLNPLPVSVAGMMVLAGVAVWLVDALLEGLVTQLSGLPPVDLQPGMMPNTLLEIILYAVSLAVLAPICEDIVFRGAIQGAYESRRKPGFAIPIVAVMFALWHFRPTGLLALLPLAFLLSYVVWRTQSLYAGMLVHFGNNLGAAIIALVSFLHPGTAVAQKIVNPITALAGLVTLVLLVVLFKRRVPVPLVDDSGQPEYSLEPQPSALSAYWPLWVGVVLFVVIGGVSMVGLTASAKGVEFTSPDFRTPQVFEYRILNQGGEEVGSATCRVTPQDGFLLLDCERDIRAYELTIGQSFWSQAEHHAEWTAEWSLPNLELWGYTFNYQPAAMDGLTGEIAGGKISVHPSDGSLVQADIAPWDLMQDEWVWRMAYAKLQPGQFLLVNRASLYRWDEKTKKSGPAVLSEKLKVYPDESVTVPAGTFTARKITIGSDAAWYDTGATPRLLKFDNDMEVYELR